MCSLVLFARMCCLVACDFLFVDVWLCCSCSYVGFVCVCVRSFVCLLVCLFVCCGLCAYLFVGLFVCWLVVRLFVRLIVCLC